MTMTSDYHPSRRAFMVGVGAAALASLASPSLAHRYKLTAEGKRFYSEIYSPLPKEKFPVPGVDFSSLDPTFLRQAVDYETTERVGTVIVDTGHRLLYLIRPGGKAIRYGIGIGRAGFEWSGRAVIQFKRQWPTWTPPAAMIAREPELEKWRHGMPPSLENPLGARALYIFRGGVDTLYRLHGNGDVNSIGRAVSSGCVRLLHQDVIDLYNRVPDNSPIIVL